MELFPSYSFFKLSSRFTHIITIFFIYVTGIDIKTSNLKLHKYISKSSDIKWSPIRVKSIWFFGMHDTDTSYWQLRHFLQVKRRFPVMFVTNRVSIMMWTSDRLFSDISNCSPHGEFSKTAESVKDEPRPNSWGRFIRSEHSIGTEDSN